MSLHRDYKLREVLRLLPLPPGPAQRAQDAPKVRSRAKRGMGHRPTEGCTRKGQAGYVMPLKRQHLRSGGGAHCILK